MVRLNNEAFQRIVDAITEAYGVCADEIIQYEIHSSKMWIAFFVVVSVVTAGIMLAMFIHNKRFDMKWYDGEWSITVFTVGIVLLIFFLVCILWQIDDIYIARYFPEKTLMNHIKNTVENLVF